MRALATGILRADKAARIGLYTAWERAPHAALMPCSVERYLVVKSSTGTMKVVALGPKLAKKNVSACTMSRRTELRLIV